MKERDTRMKQMTEILSGMKVLKLYAWELPFMDRINKIREKEIGFLSPNKNWIDRLGLPTSHKTHQAIIRSDVAIIIVWRSIAKSKKRNRNGYFQEESKRFIDRM